MGAVYQIAAGGRNAWRCHAPARDALLALLDLPEAERPAAARDLMGRLDELLPSDPAMAAVLAEEMAAAFAEGAEEGTTKDTKYTKGAGEGTTEGTEHTEALENEDRKPDGEFAPKGTGDQTGGGSLAAPAPSGAARNDGKIDFSPLSRKKPAADAQARELGYAGADDLLAQSATVPQERIDAILQGSAAPCKPHEAIAAIRSGATVKAANGEDVKLTEGLVRHYVCGERRKTTTTTRKSPTSPTSRKPWP